MIDFCAAHGISAQVEVIDADRIDEAYERLLAGDVRYRFVIDQRRWRKRSSSFTPERMVLQRG